MSTIILLLGIIILAVLNIFVYRRINRNAEIYARWYLQDCLGLSWTVDKLVNEKKIQNLMQKYRKINIWKEMLIKTF